MTDEWIKEDNFLKTEGYQPSEIKRWNGKKLLTDFKLDFEIVKFTSKQINKLLSKEQINSDDADGDVIEENFEVIQDDISSDEPSTFIDDDDDDDDEDDCYDDDDDNNY